MKPLGLMPTPLKKYCHLCCRMTCLCLDQSTSVSFRIGFLGLGLMGSGIVSNLLKMGHTVTVWNRTAEKVSIKGEVYQTLQSVVTEGSRHLCLYLTYCTHERRAELCPGRKICKMLLYNSNYLKQRKV